MTNPELRKEIEGIVARIFQAGFKSGKHETGLQMVIASDVIEPAAIDELVALFIRQHRQMIPEEIIPPTAYEDLYVEGFDACRQQMLDTLEGEKK